MPDSINEKRIACFHMRPFFLLYTLLLLQALKGVTSDEDSQSDYHLPGKIILSNIIRQQSRPSYLQKCSARDNLINNLEGNVLTQFLSRFQPALDREAKKLMETSSNNREHYINRVGMPVFLTAQDKAEKYHFAPLLWRETRDDEEQQKPEKKMTQCTRVPGRILCKFGPYTYVINTRNRDLDNEELEKVVGMMHQRVQEGDKSFDLSIVSLKDKMNAAVESSPEPFFLPEDGGAVYDSPPIIVECTPVTTRRTKLSVNNENVEEIVYSCKWHSLKLKRGVEINNSLSNNKVKANEKEVYSAPVGKSCQTQVFVRKFTDVCLTSPGWCPETTLTPCPSTQLPKCIPWCNPFFKEAKNHNQQIHDVK